MNNLLPLVDATSNITSGLETERGLLAALVELGHIIRCERLARGAESTVNFQIRKVCTLLLHRDGASGLIGIWVASALPGHNFSPP